MFTFFFRLSGIAEKMERTICNKLGIDRCFLNESIVFSYLFLIFCIIIAKLNKYGVSISMLGIFAQCIKNQLFDLVNKLY